MDSNKRLTWAVDAGEEETEKMQKKRRLRSPSSSDENLQPGAVSMYYESVCELLNQLPSCWLLWSQDWSSLLKDSSSSDDSALQFELVSLCHWFLTTEAPEPFKKGANQTLATHMFTDHQASYYSLERLLDSKNELVIQQACCAIAFLCWCYCCNYVKDLSFVDDVVVDKLFNLVEKYSLYSAHLVHARHAICSIAWVDNRVKEKIIIKSELDTSVKWPFLFGDTDKAEHACMIVACIFGGKKDDEAWYTIVDALIPPIVDVMEKAPEDPEVGDIPVMVAAAYAIASATDGTTPKQIEKLFALGCLRVLCHNLNVPSPSLANHILDGIDDILKAGYMEGNKKYVEWIVDDENSPCVVAYKKKHDDWIDYDEKCTGWVAFRNVGDEFLYFPDDIKIFIQYRAYDIANRYGGCMWLFSLIVQYPWL